MGPCPLLSACPLLSSFEANFFGQEATFQTGATFETRAQCLEAKLGHVSAKLCKHSLLGGHGRWPKTPPHLL